MSNRAQSATCEPCATTFIARDRSPTTRAATLSTRIDATADRSRSRDYNEARRTVRRSIQCNVGVSDDFDLTDTERHQRFAHALSQLAAACTRKTDLRRDQIAATQLRRGAGT